VITGLSWAISLTHFDFWTLFFIKKKSSSIDTKANLQKLKHVGKNFNPFYCSSSHNSLWIVIVIFFKKFNLILELFFCTIESFWAQIRAKLLFFWGEGWIERYRIEVTKEGKMDGKSAICLKVHFSPLSF